MIPQPIAVPRLSFSRSLLGFVSLLLLFLAAPRVDGQAQSTPTGAGKLAAIQATGSKRYSSEQIAAAAGLRIGQIVQKDDFQGAANRLAALGPFANIRFRFSSKGEDVTLEFQLEDAPALPVSFDNFPWFTDAELAQAFQEAGIAFDGTAPEQGTILDAMDQALTKILATRGVHGTVEHQVLAAPDGDQKWQQFHLVGSNLIVGALEFSDPLALRDRSVHLHLPDIVGHPYSRFAIEMFDFEQVRPVYLSNGHLRVRFGPAKARFAGDPTKPLPDLVSVLVPVEPGAEYKWGGVTWTGNRVLATSELDGFIGLKTGDLADGMKIFAAWEHVRDAYAQRGYLDAQLTTEPNFDEAVGRAAYRAAIVEGSQYRMGDLILSGLSIEGEKRIRAGWKLAKGDVFDRIYFDAFIDQGAKQALGDLPVHYEQIGRLLRSDPKTSTTDVLLDFH